MDKKLNADQLAALLRAALGEIQEFSTNEYFGNNSIAETLKTLETQFPVFTHKEQCFIDVVKNATGLSGIEKYVVAMRDIESDYMTLENGARFSDCEIIFWGAYQLGLNREFEES
jgi:hypothetical protein